MADKHGGRPLSYVAGAEIPAEDRLNTEDLEEIGRDVCDRRARRLRRARNDATSSRYFAIAWKLRP